MTKYIDGELFLNCWLMVIIIGNCRFMSNNVLSCRLCTQLLNLTSIHKEMTYQLQKSPDEVLHVDKGLVMTFRVVVGAGSREELRTHEEVRVTLRYHHLVSTLIMMIVIVVAIHFAAACHKF